VASLRRIVEAARRTGRPIVHIVRLYLADGSNVDPCRRAAVEAGWRALRPGTAGCELVPGVRPASGGGLDAERLLQGRLQELAANEWAVYKPRWGAFFGTALRVHLDALRVDTLVIAGFNYPNCPRATVYEASERDFRIVLVRDAVSRLDRRGLAEMAAIGVTSRTAASVGVAWTRLRGRRDPKPGDAAPASRDAGEDPNELKSQGSERPPAPRSPPERRSREARDRHGAGPRASSEVPGVDRRHDRVSEPQLDEEDRRVEVVDGRRRLQADPVLGADPIDQGMGRGTRGQGDELQAVEVCDLDPSAPCPWIPGRRDQHEGYFERDALLERASFSADAHECEVGLVPKQRLETLSRRVRRLEAKRAVGEPAAEAHHRLPEQVADRGSARRDAELARFAVAEALDIADAALDRAQADAPCLVQKPAGGGFSHALGASLEERHPKLAFQAGDVVPHGRLRAAEPPGDGAQALELADGDEDPEIL
jgi:nicotinamidase-related amidase